MIFSVSDYCAGATGRRATAFVHVDTQFEPSKELEYILTAEALRLGCLPRIEKSFQFTADVLTME